MNGPGQVHSHSNDNPHQFLRLARRHTATEQTDDLLFTVRDMG